MIMCAVSRQLLVRGAAVMLAVATAIGAPALSRAANDNRDHPCFFLSAWDGQWKVSPDSRTLYVAESGVVFRVDLQQPIPMLQSPWAILSTRGTSDAVCQPEDFHLEVSNRLGGFDTPIVRKITALTPAEVAALPKKLRPRW